MDIVFVSVRHGRRKYRSTHQPRFQLGVFGAQARRTMGGRRRPLGGVGHISTYAKNKHSFSALGHTVVSGVQNNRWVDTIPRLAALTVKCIQKWAMAFPQHTGHIFHEEIFGLKCDDELEVGQKQQVTAIIHTCVAESMYGKPLTRRPTQHHVAHIAVGKVGTHQLRRGEGRDVLLVEYRKRIGHEIGAVCVARMGVVLDGSDDEKTSSQCRKRPRAAALQPARPS